MEGYSMKKGSILVLVLVFVMAFSGSIYAYEFVGGGIYTTFELDGLNDRIETINDEIESASNSVGFEAKKLEKMESSFGFYGGLRFNTTPKTDLDLTYERLVPSTDIEINYSDSNGTLDYDTNLDLNINGIVATLRNKVSDNIRLNGGVGYYFATFESKTNVNGTGVYSTTDETQSEEFDYNGFGFKLGADYDYPINNSSDIFASLNYRILELDPDNSDADKLNTNGIEFKGGLSYNF